jgi:hypothetical protein
MSSAGYFKCWRSTEAMELMRASPNAYILLSVIAWRAQRTAGFNRHNLKPGEALIGDFKNYGMSEQNYRTAKRILSEAKFATFKPTSKGTVSRITNTRIFDINADSINEQNNRQPTDAQRTPNDYQECKEAIEQGSQQKFSLKKAFAEQMLEGGQP